MQTAKKTVVPFASRDVAPKDLKLHLEGIAADVDGLRGIERLTQRIQDDLEALAEEVRS